MVRPGAPMTLETLPPAVRWAAEELVRRIMSGETGRVTVEFSQGGVREMRIETSTRPPSRDPLARHP